ncbi:hypothetical protein RI129_009378 [Pyrocoelia pectoralis]|uniref:Aminotransferase class I/classII large domain-containing protein n=1 Tax=Pyrocoelia pectoralis TaxID=417401 RepID=A0AAN7V997_9COLE
MSPAIAAHIVDVLKVLMGKDGTNLGHTRMSTLARNLKYFRRRLHQIGVIVKGSEDSPIVPIMCYFHSKTTAMVRLLLEKNIACTGVMYPVTSFLECRIRICLSPGNTREQLDYALKIISEVVDHIGIKYSRLPHSNEPVEY